MDNLLNYFLIGIGEFSHGIYQSWEFRFKLLKYVMKNTNNNTIWSRKDNKFIKYDGIKFEEPIQNNNYVGGKL
jgi:hypothetical protein